MTRHAAPALVLLTAIVVLFPIEGLGPLAEQPVGRWLAVALTLALAATAGGHLAADGLTRRPPGPWTRREALPLLAILALAALLRGYRLADLPPWLDYDSVQNGWIGLELLRRGQYQAVLTDWASGNETAFMYVLGAFLSVSHSITALRLPAAIAGTLTVAVVYLLGRRCFGLRVAQASAVLVAVAPWHIHLSRMAKQPLLVPLFVALGLWCLAGALLADDDDEGGDGGDRDTRRRRAWLAGCGAAIGLGLNFYEAFRVFPLAVAAILVLARGWRRGLPEVALVALTAALVAAPLLLEAVVDPANFMRHVSSNAVTSEIADQRSLAPLLRNAAVTGTFLTVDLPRLWARGDEWIPTAFGALPAVLLCGAVGLWLRGRATPDPARARLLLGATALVMIPPFLFPRFDLTSPRRFGGMLVPLYLAGGGLVVGLLRATAARFGGRTAWAVGLLGLAALVAEMPVVFEGFAEPPRTWLTSERAIADQRLVRRAHAEARAGRRVFLAPGVAGEGYLARFFLAHPRIERLPSAWPLPAGDLSGACVFVGGGPLWARPLTALGATSERAHGVVIHTLDGAALARRRAKADGLPGGFDGHLLVARPGRYTFAPTDGLTLGGAPLGGPVLLAAGPVPFRYAGGAPLTWTPPGGAAAPVPADRCWTGDVGPAAPAVAPWRLLPVERTRTDIPVDPAFDFNRALQDVARAPRGWWLADTDRHPLKLWRAGEEARAIPLFDGDRLRTHGLRYQGAVLKRYSVAADASDAGRLWWLDREEDDGGGGVRATVRPLRLSDDRGQLGAPVPSLRRPVDLGAARGWLVVADRDRRALVWHGDREVPALGDVDPVAVALGPGRLAFVDARASALVVVALTWTPGPALGAVRRFPLPRVSPAMRVSLAPDDRVLLADPLAEQLWMFGPDGLLAPGGDCDLAARLVRPFDVEGPIAAALAGERLVLVGRRAVLSFREVEDPDRRRGLTLAVGDAEGHGFRVDREWGPEPSAIDLGVFDRTVTLRWSLPELRAGDYEVWALYACDDPRPWEVRVGEAGAREPGTTTGGYSPRHLRWTRLPEPLSLRGGERTLTLVAAKRLPHLVRLRLVRR